MTEANPSIDAFPRGEDVPQVGHTESSGGLAMWMLLATGAGAVVGMAVVVGDMVSAAFLLFILLMGIWGRFRGGAKILASLLGLLAVVRWAGLLSPYLEMAAARSIEQIPEPMREFTCLVAAGLVIWIGVILTVRALSHLLFRSKPHWKGIDRGIGAVLGGAEGIILSAIFLFAALILEPIAKQQIETKEGAPASLISQSWPATVVSVTESVRESSMGKLLESMEPLRSRFDRRMKDMIGTSDEAGAPDGSFRNRLMPWIEHMRDDRTARSTISSQTGLDDATLQSLLDSPEFEQTLEKMTK